MIGDRIKKVKGLIKKEKLDAVLVSSFYNILYLTGLDFFIPIERDAFLILTKKNSYILTYKMYEEPVRKKLKGFKIEILSREKPLKKVLKKIYKSETIKNLGIEEEDLKVSEFKLFKKGIKTRNIDLLQVRRIKSKEEIKDIEKACKLSDKAFEHILDKLKVGITEIEVANLIKEFIRKWADISFEPIVAFGENSSAPHHKASSRRLKVGDFILLDLGAMINNYCSDMTRTIFFRKITKEQEQVYKTVLKSQNDSIEFINNSKGRITGGDVDEVSRQTILNEGFPDYPYTLGHGIGLEVHEHRFLAPKSEEVLQDGMVFSIEPGIHIPNFGGVRIEDLFVFEKGKLRRLTKSRRELIVI